MAERLSGPARTVAAAVAAAAIGLICSTLAPRTGYAVPIGVLGLLTIAAAIRSRPAILVGVAAYLAGWLLVAPALSPAVPVVSLLVAGAAWVCLVFVERRAQPSWGPGRLFAVAALPLLPVAVIAAVIVVWLRQQSMVAALADPVVWQLCTGTAAMVVALSVAAALWGLRRGWNAGVSTWRTMTVGFAISALTGALVVATVAYWETSTTTRLSDAATTIAATMQTRVGDDQSAYAGRLSTAPRQPWDSEAAFVLGNEPLLIGNPAFSVVGLLLPQQGDRLSLPYQINRVPDEAEPAGGWGALLGAAPEDVPTVLSTTEVGPLLLGVRTLPGAQGDPEPSVVYVGPQTVPQGSPPQFLTAAVSLATELDQSILSAGPEASLMRVSLSQTAPGGGVGPVLLTRGPDAVEHPYSAVSSQPVTIGDSEFLITATEAEGLGTSERGRWLIVLAQVLIGLLLLVAAMLAATSRYRILRRLEERESLLAAAIEAAPGLVMLIDTDRRIVMANSTSTEHSALVGTSVFRALPFDLSADDRVRLDGMIDASLVGGSGVMECTDVGASETLRIHEIATSPVPSREGIAAAALVQVIDVTDSRWQAMRDAQSERLEALGAMAGGLAHDFNNLLFIINGYIQLMQADKRIQAEPELARYVDHAGDAAERGTEIAKSLLSVTRSQPLQATAVSVGTFLRGIVPIARQALGTDVALDLRIEESPLEVLVDAGQLSSSVLNLVINARDAVDRDGSVLLAARRMHVDAHADDELAPGDYVAIDVTDDGAGMPPDVEMRAFEPFFTTKPVGQGSGLGLASVYSFARQSGGTARIRSRVGQGTTVSIIIPALPTGQRSSAASESGTSVSRVLIVDDERALAGLVAGWITDRGLEVRVASSMDEALAAAAEFEPDLLLTDMNIGTEVDGLDVAARVTLMLPEVSVVFMTGFSDRMQELQERGMRTLPKPFGRQDLYRVLLSADGEPPAADAESPADGSDDDVRV